MRQYSLTHLSDAALLKDLGTLVAQDRATTASLLAHIAEVDARKLYLPAGYPSMHAYCVDELRLSEDAAFIRIRAARAARLVPALFDAVATGELNVTAVNLLAPHLTMGNAPELIALAARKRKTEIEALLAARFPRSEFLAIGEVSRLNETPVQLAPGRVDAHVQLVPERVGAGNSLSANAPIFEAAGQRADSCGSESPDSPRPRVTPVSAERYLLHVPIDRATHEKLKHAVALLGHSIPSGDVAQVLDRALDVLGDVTRRDRVRSEEHTSELQSQFHLVCRLLLEKKNNHRRHSDRDRIHIGPLVLQVPVLPAPRVPLIDRRTRLDHRALRSTPPSSSVRLPPTAAR